MTKPIIIVEDDEDDRNFIIEVLSTLRYPNDVIIMEDSMEVIDFIKTLNTPPLFILSDVNMPGLNGFELRSKFLDTKDNTIRNIPFLLYNTIWDRDSAQKACDYKANGFFAKTNDINEFRKILITIINYWTTAITANDIATK